MYVILYYMLSQIFIYYNVFFSVVIKAYQLDISYQLLLAMLECGLIRRNVLRKSFHRKNKLPHRKPEQARIFS